MKCQNCGKDEANVKYTQIINGKKKEMLLCEECARKMGINNFKISMPIHFSNFLDNFFDEENIIPEFIKEKEENCNKCEENYEEFIQTGLLGCADCYENFEEKLNLVLKNIQGSTRHKGRKPLRINVNKYDKEKDKMKNNIKNYETKENNKLEELEVQLNIAIKEERYEDAAIIRDKIKKIKSL